MSCDVNTFYFFSPRLVFVVIFVVALVVVVVGRDADANSYADGPPSHHSHRYLPFPSLPSFLGPPGPFIVL